MEKRWKKNENEKETKKGEPKKEGEITIYDQSKGEKSGKFSM